MDVSNCNGNFCKLKRGESNKMALTFKTINEATSLKASLRATIFGISMSLPGGPYDVCEHIANDNPHCPVPADTIVKYDVTFAVPNWAPGGMRSTVTLQITDQKTDIVTCVQIPVVVA